jgi:xylan 1,4-beta-xylosidase
MYLERGGMVAGHNVAAPVDAVATGPLAVRRKLGGDLASEFQWLRTPEPARIFREETDCLTLIGRESIGSWFEQALVARRQEHHAYAAETTLDFAPITYQQAAGLTTYYNAHKYHAIVVTHDAKLGRVLSMLSCPGDWPDAAVQFPMDPIPLMDGPVTVNHAEQQFWYLQDKDWRKAGPVLDASVISDEGGKGEHASFTGAFVGMIAFDITGQGAEACFAQFDYVPDGAQ